MCIIHCSLYLYIYTQTYACVLSHPVIWGLWNPMNCSPTGSSVCGIFQARILEWAAISPSKGSSQPRDQTRVSCIPHMGRRILYYWATWEAPHKPNLNINLSIYNILQHRVPMLNIFDSILNWKKEIYNWICVNHTVKLYVYILF